MLELGLELRQFGFKVWSLKSLCGALSLIEMVSTRKTLKVTGVKVEKNKCILIFMAFMNFYIHLNILKIFIYK